MVQCLKVPGRAELAHAGARWRTHAPTRARPLALERPSLSLSLCARQTAVAWIKARKKGPKACLVPPKNCTYEYTLPPVRPQSFSLPSLVFHPTSSLPPHPTNSLHSRLPFNLFYSPRLLLLPYGSFHTSFSCFDSIITKQQDQFVSTRLQFTLHALLFESAAAPPSCSRHRIQKTPSPSTDAWGSCIHAPLPIHDIVFISVSLDRLDVPLSLPSRLGRPP